MPSPRSLDVIISTSNALCDWLREDLQRIPSQDGAHIGQQPLRSDEHTVSWQCHLVTAGSPIYGGTVIAVEARSRYTLLLPFERVPSREQLEKALLQRWIKEVSYMAVTLAAVADPQMEAIFEQFLRCPITLYWYRNDDPALNESLHVAEQALKDTLSEYRLEVLDEVETSSVGLHLNRLLNRGNVNASAPQPHSPYERFLADALFRFARGLAETVYPDTPDGDFPNPYTNPVAPLQPDDLSLEKVISMADFLRKRARNPVK